MTNSNKPHPDVYLTDVHNNILYLFHAPFQTAGKIVDVTVKDLNDQQGWRTPSYHG